MWRQHVRVPDGEYVGTVITRRAQRTLECCPGVICTEHAVIQRYLRWAGHVARLPLGHVLRAVDRWRCASWWREVQRDPGKLNSLWSWPLAAIGEKWRCIGCGGSAMSGALSDVSWVRRGNRSVLLEL